MTEQPANQPDTHRPPGWYRGTEGKRYWDGQAWLDTAPSHGGVSGVAIASMILGIIGLLIGLNALFKPRLFLGLVDVFGPILFAILAVVLAIAAGRRSTGFRLAGFICGGLSALLGVLIIAAL